MVWRDHHLLLSRPLPELIGAAMVRVGVHVSIAGSVVRSVERAANAGCDTFQIFSRNPRGWAFHDLSGEDSSAFKKELTLSGIFPPVDHMPYLPNLATPKPEVYEKSVMTLTAELQRCGQLEIPYLVTHLGHHLGDGLENGRKRVIEALTSALADADNKVMILLENTAGEKNSVGSTFEDIRAVLDGISPQERVGVCFDTCHAFAAGYDIRRSGGIEATMDQLDDLIGLERLRVIHLNDALGDLGSGLDRHEHIGMGSIGEKGFKRILTYHLFHDLPLICETPIDIRRDDRGNMAKVRELAR